MYSCSTSECCETLQNPGICSIFSARSPPNPGISSTSSATKRPNPGICSIFSARSPPNPGICSIFSSRRPRYSAALSVQRVPRILGIYSLFIRPPNLGICSTFSASETPQILGFAAFAEFSVFVQPVVSAQIRTRFERICKFCTFWPQLRQGCKC